LEPEINAIIKSRLKKLEILYEKGIDPYPTGFKPTHNTKACLELLCDIEKKGLEKSEVIYSAGRITAIRKMGKAIFIDILDEVGKIQLLARNNAIDEETNELFTCVAQGMDVQHGTVKEIRIGIGTGIVGHVVCSGELFSCADACKFCFAVAK
jgi:lysyl-tRNA synthetase class II